MLSKYLNREHRLAKLATGGKGSELAAAALGQKQVAEGPGTFVFSGVYERTARRYEERAVRSVYIEAGHAAQNIVLQAVALGLGSAVMGAFEDGRVKSVLGMPEEEAGLLRIEVRRALLPSRWRTTATRIWRNSSKLSAPAKRRTWRRAALWSRWRT